MTESPQIHVRAVNLGGKSAVAVLDTRTVLELGIDFSRPPDVIANALTLYIREAIESGRWVRRGTCAPDDVGTEPPEPGPL